MNTYKGNYEKLMEDYEDIQFRVGLWNYAQALGEELIAENEQLKKGRQHELTPKVMRKMDVAIGN